MFVRVEPAHVSEISLGVNRTRDRVDFKRNAGQNNHFLITVLVGLDAVRDGTAKLNPEFSTSWSPRDTQQSSTRSREYALVTSLAWITDLVDVYRKRLQTTPSILSETVSARINKIDGRADRLAELASTLGLPRDDRNLLMLQFATRWRNTIVHSDAGTRIGSNLRSALRRSAQEISTAHRGLDINRSITSFEGGDAPTFKEVASFISAAQLLVADMDSAAITKMNVAQYAESLIGGYFSTAFVSNPQVFSQFWPGDPTKTQQRMTKLLTQLGFTYGKPQSRLKAEFLVEMSRISAHEARQRYATFCES